MITNVFWLTQKKWMTLNTFEPMEATERRIKLIWEFHGPDSRLTAQHHAKHLKEYGESNEVTNHMTGVGMIDTGYIAYIIVNESEMIAVRDALIPLRGELA